MPGLIAKLRVFSGQPGIVALERVQTRDHIIKCGCVSDLR